MMAVGLNAAQVFRHLCFKLRFGFAEEMVEQHIFGRNRRIGFKIVQPVTVFALVRPQGIGGRLNLIVETCVKYVRRHHAVQRCLSTTAAAAAVGMSGSGAFQ